MSKDTIVVTAFLAALVTTPPDEGLPTITAEIITNPNHFFKTIKKETGHLSFWERFNNFHDQLHHGYTGKDRAKILRSTVSSEESDEAAGMEITNVTLSAEEIISSPEPIQIARESYVESGLDPLSWSVGLTGWQP
ncbi:hypothetical protein PN441_12575 [Spirulina major CS-329]|uniref:hypothetical protein n=1 Tax=Spirulina TaxID=1154 RepID=UPI00232AD37B|nr:MULTISPECIES: hypothetical protein [Spirulina]MDB9495556.1 hypothetical protein [Spirulina subsalsa CS-330]MDB9503907.1 hypothetical protein [Spirulina major CS-329]